jgi:hypothetical protein
VRDGRAKRRTVEWLAGHSVIDDDAANRCLVDHSCPNCRNWEIRMAVDRRRASRNGRVEATKDLPLWWHDGVGQADPSHIRLRRT